LLAFLQSVASKIQLFSVIKRCEVIMLRAFYFFTGLTLLLLGGCAVSPEIDSSNTAESPSSGVGSHVSSASSEEKLPSADFPPQVLYQLLVAELAGQRGQLDVAVANYLAAAKDSQEPEIAARATRISMFTQALGEALEAAELWVKLEPKSPDARKALAPLLLTFGRAPEAVVHYEKFVALSASKPDHGFSQISSQLSRDKNNIAALSVMDKLLEKNKDLPHAWLAHAQLTMHQIKLKLALESVDHALEIKSHWAPAVVLRARIIGLQGNKQKALDYLEDERGDALENDIGVGLSYARLLTEVSQFQKAREEFERLAVLQPRNPDVIYAAGVLALQLKDYDLAEKRLKQVLSLGSRTLGARFYLGRLYEQKDNFTLALKHFLGVRHGEFYLGAQTRAASLLAELGRLEKARDLLHSLRVSTDQERVRIYLVEGELLRKAEKYQEAFEFLSAKLEEVPDDTSLRYARALMAEKMDALEVAEKDLLVIIEREPSNAQALNALGYTLADRTQRFDEALNYIERAMAVKPEDAAIIDSMGWVQYRMGNHEKAVELLRRAMELIQDVEIAAHLGEVLWAMGNKQGALEVWEKALKENPNHKVLNDIMKRFGL
jgi:tetratricopeptide (TPR) repeat protein